jgi:hypothetical protein
MGVTTCQVVASGNVSGSVVAMTARSVFSDPVRTCLHFQGPPALLGAIAKRPPDRDPLAGLFRTLPASRATSCNDPGVPPRCAPVMRGLEGTHRAQFECSEPCSHSAVLSGEGVRSHCSKGDSLGVRSINHFQCDRVCGPKGGILLALHTMMSRSGGLDIDGGIDPQRPPTHW